MALREKASLKLLLIPAVLLVVLALSCGSGSPWSEDPCVETANTDVDILQVTTLESDYVEDQRRIVATFERSGDNARAEVESYGPDYETLERRAQAIIKDGVAYRRGSANPDDPASWEEWEVQMIPELDEDSELRGWWSDYCFGADEGDPDRRFFWRITSSGSPGSEKNEETVQFQVDSMGRPFRVVITDTTSYFLDDGTLSGWFTHREEATFSGWGEPNVITAPIGVPTPAPSPKADGTK